MNDQSLKNKNVNIYAEIPDHYKDGSQPKELMNASFTQCFVQQELDKQKQLNVSRQRVPAAVSKLLQSSESSESVYKAKIKDKIITLETALTGKAKKSKEYLEHKKKKKAAERKAKPMSSKQAKKLQIFKCPKSILKYSVFVPLNELWLSYARQLLQDCQGNTDRIFSKMLKADLNGSSIAVVQSSCPNFLGISGICIKESEQMFYIIEKTNKLKKVRKQHNIFTVTVDEHRFTIYGDQFRIRPSDRITKKFKAKPTIDL